jgi:hypothetical protein
MQHSHKGVLLATDVFGDLILSCHTYALAGFNFDSKFCGISSYCCLCNLNNYINDEKIFHFNVIHED